MTAVKSETRTAMEQQLAELSALASEVYDNLMNAHEHNYLDTMAYFNAAQHVGSVWRIIDYASRCLAEK